MFDKNRHKSDDRILVLQAIQGREEEAEKSLGGALLKGNNKLHAEMDPQFTSWKLRLDKGGVPHALRSKFTGFSQALKAAENYFEKMGIKVVEVKD